MSLEPNPTQDPDLFDSIILGSATSPGVVKLSGHDSKVDWDIKEGAGQRGASMTKKGEKPISFTATFYLADDEEQDAWPAFAALINSTVAGKTPTALDIYHPNLESNGIRSVVKGSIGGCQHDGKGGQTYVVTFQQYAPPVASGGSPSGSATKPKKASAPDPNAAALAELAALTKQYQSTPAG